MLQGLLLCTLQICTFFTYYYHNAAVEIHTAVLKTIIRGSCEYEKANHRYPFYPYAVFHYSL